MDFAQDEISASETIYTNDSASLGWIGWHVRQQDRRFLCEIEESFIEDSFNLFGLKQYLDEDEYNLAYNTILDKRGRESFCPFWLLTLLSDILI
jgi:hypothetical protein